MKKFLLILMAGFLITGANIEKANADPVDDVIELVTEDMVIRVPYADFTSTSVENGSAATADESFLQDEGGSDQADPIEVFQDKPEPGSDWFEWATWIHALVGAVLFWIGQYFYKRRKRAN